MLMEQTHGSATTAGGAARSGRRRYRSCILPGVLLYCCPARTAAGQAWHPEWERASLAVQASQLSDVLAARDDAECFSAHADQSGDVSPHAFAVMLEQQRPRLSVAGLQPASDGVLVPGLSQARSADRREIRLHQELAVRRRNVSRNSRKCCGNSEY